MPPEEKAHMKSCRPLDMEAARGTGNFRNDIANDVMEAAGIEVRARRARPAPRALRRRIASVRPARVLTRPRSPAHVLAGRSCACGSPLRWLAPAHAL